VEFQLTEDDVVPGLRRQLIRNGRIRLFFLVGVLLVLIGGLSIVAINGAFGAVFAFIGLFYVALITSLVIVGPRRAWRRNPVLRGPQYIAFSPDGIYARSILAESRAQWPIYAGMIETERCYMLRLATRKAYLFVPKRAFKSWTDETVFRHLVGLRMRVEAGPARPRSASTRRRIAYVHPRRQ
jgi:hypothetical protein